MQKSEETILYKLGFVISVDMKATFVNPPSSSNIYSCTHLGIAYCAAVLRKEGWDVSIIDSQPMGLSVDDVAGMLIKEQPDIVGFTAYKNQIDTVTEIAKKVKSDLDCKISLGGVHATVATKSLLDFDCFDNIIMGESESFLPKVFRGIVMDRDVPKVVKGKYPKNLDKLPFPAHDLLPIEKYHLPYTNKRPSYLSGSRGCPYNCFFCSIPKNPMRFRTPENILDEMIYLNSKFGVKFINFSDEVFSLNRKNLVYLCDLIIKEKLDIAWGGQTRCDLVDKELLRKMRSAGCEYILFGVESGVYRIRKFLGKDISDQVIKNVFEICNKLDIDTDANFILGSPSETLSDMIKTLEFALDLNPTYCLFHEYKPYLAGSSDYRKEIDKVVVRRMVRKSYLNFYIRPNQIKRLIIKHKKSDMRLAIDFLRIIRSSFRKSTKTI